MKRFVFLFLGCMLGSFCMLTAQESNLIDLDYDPLVAFNEKGIHGENILDVKDIFARSKHLKRHSSKNSFVFFRAILTSCRIGENDRDLLADGSVDFVTAFGGNDFSCTPLPKGGIEISPQNGTSFQLSIPPVPEPGPVPGGLFDHVKFLAYSLFEDLPSDNDLPDCSHHHKNKRRQLCSTWVGSGEQLNVDSNPFGQFSPNPNADPRLASFCFVSLNPVFLTTFDWICTNDIIYALVERLPGRSYVWWICCLYLYVPRCSTRHM